MTLIEVVRTFILLDLRQKYFIRLRIFTNKSLYVEIFVFLFYGHFNKTFACMMKTFSHYSGV